MTTYPATNPCCAHNTDLPFIVQHEEEIRERQFRSAECVPLARPPDPLLCNGNCRPEHSLHDEPAEILGVRTAVAWFAHYRAKSERYFSDQDRLLASTLGPHLRETLRINRLLRLERLRARANWQCLGIIDGRGCVHFSDPGFDDLLHPQWPDWDDGAIPTGLRQAFTSGAGRCAGKAMVGGASPRST